MKKINRIKKAYKKYGKEDGCIFLRLFCSYNEGMNRLYAQNNQKAMANFRTRFNQYVKDEYGQDFFDSYTQFYENNKDNKKLLKLVFKKYSQFVDCRIFALMEEPKEKTKQKGKYEHQEEQEQNRYSNQEKSKIQGKKTYAQSRHSYMFTMRRLSNDEIFTTYHNGKDLNEAMAIVNRLYFDSAMIVNI